MQKELTIIHSLNITGRGIYLELQHQESGLAKDTVLLSKLSEQTNKKWKIRARIIHFGSEKKFEIETLEVNFLAFTSVEKRISSEKNILDRENKNIFWYSVIPINHDEKPIEGEKLLIITDL